MARYWVVRTDRDNIPFIWSELKKGRLRQGWGYQADQDLNVISELRSKGESVNDDQKMCWRGNRRLLYTQPDGVSIGDIILAPHLPRYGVWSLVRVAGEYRFDFDNEVGDYGHILPVGLITEKRSINPYEAAVSALLRQTMRNQSRMWNIDSLSNDVDHLIEAFQSGASSETLTERLPEILGGLENAAWKSLTHHYHGTEFEKPCVLLLNTLYGEGNVEHTGGSSERGADAICTYTDPLGVVHRVAVQIKMWDWDAAWTKPLEQIRQAYDEYEGITGGVIIATSEKVTPGFEKARQSLERELGVPIRVILRQELLHLFIQKLPSIVQFEMSSDRNA